MNKNIVLFINSLSSGGAEHQLVVLADCLIEKGYNVTITTFGDWEEHYKYSNSINRYRIAPGKSNIIKMLAICKYFLTVHADCIIGFGQRVNRFFLLPLMLRSRKKIKAIAGERSLTVDQPSLYERIMLDFHYLRANYIVPNSYAQRNRIIKLKPQYEGKTITITNYTDTATYQVKHLPNGTILRLGVFGRYDASKNCIRFVDSMKLLVEQTQQRFTVEWHGNQLMKGKPNPLYEEMLKKIKKSGLVEYIILNDHVKDVSTEMVKYDAIVLPSLWEGFSNAIGEAICCGKPCIVSDVGDNGVMVKDGINGFLFDPQNAESIVEAFMKYFSLTREEREAMGSASRKLAEELFDKDRFVNAYINLIESE